MTAEEQIEQAREILSRIILKNRDLAGKEKGWYYHLCCASGELDLTLQKLEKEKSRFDFETNNESTKKDGDKDKRFCLS